MKNSSFHDKSITKKILSSLRNGIGSQDIICDIIDPDKLDKNSPFYAKIIMLSFREKTLNHDMIHSYIRKINEAKSD